MQGKDFKQKNKKTAYLKLTFQISSSM